MTETGGVVVRLDGPRSIEIDTRAQTVTDDDDQPERPRRFPRRPALERIVERPGDEGAYADAPG